SCSFAHFHCLAEVDSIDDLATFVRDLESVMSDKVAAQDRVGREGARLLDRIVTCCPGASELRPLLIDSHFVVVDVEIIAGHFQSHKAQGCRANTGNGRRSALLSPRSRPASTARKIDLHRMRSGNSSIIARSCNAFDPV